MSARTLFGKPIRKETTGLFYPDDMDIRGFIEMMRSGLDAFESDLNAHGGIGNLAPDERLYIEEWVELWLAWNEIEEERE